MDTMELTKIVGALCGSLLILLLGKWAAEEIYHVGGGHGDDVAQAYSIEVAGADVEEEVEEALSMMELLASADVAKGERVFGKCRACHKLEDGANGTGPHLYALIDRPVAAVGEFNYSSALTTLGGAWDVDSLSAFLENPKGYAPGTKMAFAGLKKDTERADLIAYLQTIGG